MTGGRAVDLFGIESGHGVVAAVVVVIIHLEKR